MARMRSTLIAVPLFLLCAISVCAEDLLVKPVPVAATYDARLRLLYDYRSQGPARDTDLYAYWYGGARSMTGGFLDFYASGRTHRDMDRDSSSSLSDDPYLSVSDAGGVTENRLFQLYGDIHDRSDRVRLRVGRQYIDVADYLHVDGVQAMVYQYGKFGGGGFYGKPVSFYSSLSGDDAWGAYVVGRPWTGGRTRLTYSRYSSTNGTDGNYHVDVAQAISDEVRARAQVSILNGEFRMGQLDCYYFAADGETDFYFGGSRWGSFDAETRAYSPFYDVLGTQEPYTYGYVRLTQVILPHVAISPGVSARFADGDESYANRNYYDYDLSVTYEPVRAFSACISFDYWDMDGSDDFLGVNGDIRYRRGKQWELSLGSSYSKHTYLSYSDFTYSVNGGQTVSDQGTVTEETPFVYTYYLRGKWKMGRTLTLRLECDVEDDSDAADLAYRGRASIEVRL